MFESYIYYFKRWLFRKGKITHQEAALGIFLTVVIFACFYFAINNQPQSLASETSVTASPITVNQPQVLPRPEALEPVTPKTHYVALNPDSAATPKPVITADIKPTTKTTPKRIIKAKPKRLSSEALVTKMLREGKSIREIAKKTGLKKKYIRDIRKRKTCNCKAS